MRTGSSRAFTLVELLVVIGIIAVIISILLPALNKARRSAVQLACVSNLRQYQMYNFIYANENHGYCIPTLVQTPQYPSTLNWSQNTLYPNVRKFLGLPTSPSFFAQGSATYNQICGAALYAIQNPTGDHWYNIGYSYGMNYSDFNDPGNAYGANNRLIWWGNTGGPGTPYVPAISYQLSRMRSPSQKIAWGDSLGWWMNYSNSNAYVGEGASVTALAYRHEGGVNLAFFDGHAEWRPRKEIDKTYLSTQQIKNLWFAYQ
jgi:prepilin-type processing-associated H-X9-DG protein/prepilin-type N-terminal cleavage/methylation domain-containing protein